MMIMMMMIIIITNCLLLCAFRLFSFLSFRCSCHLCFGLPKTRLPLGWYRRASPGRRLLPVFPHDLSISFHIERCVQLCCMIVMLHWCLCFFTCPPWSVRRSHVAGLQHLTCRASFEFLRVSWVQITNFGNRVWVLPLTLRYGGVVMLL